MHPLLNTQFLKATNFLLKDSSIRLPRLLHARLDFFKSIHGDFRNEGHTKNSLQNKAPADVLLLNPPRSGVGAFLEAVPSQVLVL